MQSLYINSEKLNKEGKCENRSRSSDEEEEKPRPKTQRGKTLRGAALNSNVNTELDLLKNNSTDCCVGGGGGIYANRINKTKQVGREIVKKINTEEGKLSLSAIFNMFILLS